MTCAFRAINLTGPDTVCTTSGDHRHCPSCSLVIMSAEACPHHMTTSGDDWAVANRIMCDRIHRGIETKRLTAAERDEDGFWAHTGESA